MYNYSVPKKYLIVFVIIILALPVNFGFGFFLGHKLSLNKIQNLGPYFLPTYGVVTKVPDGDTIEITSLERIPFGVDKVSTRSIRLLGINTPEVGMPNNKEAKMVLERLVSGKKVNLEYDSPQNDKYGRILAWVWLDGKLINQEMIKTGFAVPFSMENQKLKYDLSNEN